MAKELLGTTYQATSGRILRNSCRLQDFQGNTKYCLQDLGFLHKCLDDLLGGLASHAQEALQFEEKASVVVFLFQKLNDLVTLHLWEVYHAILRQGLGDVSIIAIE